MLKHTTKKLPLAATLAALALGAAGAAADGVMDNISKAIDQGDTSFMFRYRYENVDQYPIDDEADASTLLSRITWKSGTVKGFAGLVEVDNVTTLGGESFNNTENGKTTFPVVADPEYTEVNQAWLSYIFNRSAKVTAGRQRINHSGERFLGGVSWRQNEQTYDSTRLQLTPLAGLTVDYSYIWKIHRVFDPDTRPGDPGTPGFLGNFEGHNHAVIGTYDLGGGHSLAGFGYLLDIEENPMLSSKTFGLEYKGTVKFSESVALGINLSAARQQDDGDSLLNYSAPYYMGELTAQMTAVSLAGGAAQPTPIMFGAGYEVLGSDDGVSFQTPLATLHKFQGFADKFLTTPPLGIEDAYVKAGITIAGIGLTAFYHDFQSEDGNIDYGDEIDLVATYAFNPHVSLMVKYAVFDQGDKVGNPATDTDKLWLMLTFVF